MNVTVGVSRVIALIDFAQTSRVGVLIATRMHRVAEHGVAVRELFVHEIRFEIEDFSGVGVAMQLEMCKRSASGDGVY